MDKEKRERAIRKHELITDTKEQMDTAFRMYDDGLISDIEYLDKVIHYVITAKSELKRLT